MSYWTGWGSPALIPLHFIGLDGPSYNCIRALPTSIPPLHLSPQQWPHVTPPTHVENSGRDEENLCRGQLPSIDLFSPSSVHFFLLKVVKVVVMLQTAVLLGWRLEERWEVAAGVGGLMDLTPKLSSWWPCWFLAPIWRLLRGHKDGRALAALFF